MAVDFLLVLVACGLVVLNGFFVAAEFAMVKVRGTRIDELVAEGNPRARIARRIVARLDAYLAACQVGITFASVGLGWIGEPALARVLRPLLARAGLESDFAVHGVASSAIAFGLISFLHIVIGEQGPKAWAIQDPERVTLKIAAPLRFFYVILYPAIWMTNGAANLMLRAIGLRPASEKDLAYSPKEIEMIVATSAEAGLLNERERRLLENAIGLSARLVREIMVPRREIVYLLAESTLEQNLATVLERQHTRYPLASGGLEDVIGMVHVRDLTEAIARGRNDGGVERIARPAVFVPEVASLEGALHALQRARTRLAVVVDEVGGVVGLVTLEDLLGQLVGPLRDEFDAGGRAATGPEGGGALVEAGRPFGDVAATFKLEPPRIPIDTIGGYVLHLLGRLPRVGESVDLDRWRVEVAERQGLRLTKLRFQPRAATPSPPPAAGAHDESGLSTIPSHPP